MLSDTMALPIRLDPSKHLRDGCLGAVVIRLWSGEVQDTHDGRVAQQDVILRAVLAAWYRSSLSSVHNANEPPVQSSELSLNHSAPMRRHDIQKKQDKAILLLVGPSISTAEGYTKISGPYSDANLTRESCCSRSVGISRACPG